MRPSLPLRRVLHRLLADRGLVYVDCGARRGRLPDDFRSLRTTEYIGFEGDAAECQRLNVAAKERHRFVTAFVAEHAATATFHLTNSPACASLLEPNRPFLAPFADLPALFAVEGTETVETVTLPAALAATGITSVDVLELDTQGSELAILRGAAAMLRDGILAVRTEVEFAPMYTQQPLFADVDTFMRAHAFQLFDLSRHRARRASVPAGTPTRGQLLWGHALYLRDHRTLDHAMAARLAVIAIVLDLPDFAAEILMRLADHAAPDLAASARETLPLLLEELAATAPAGVAAATATWSD